MTKTLETQFQLGAKVVLSQSAQAKLARTRARDWSVQGTVTAHLARKQRSKPQADFPKIRILWDRLYGIEDMRPTEIEVVK